MSDRTWQASWNFLRFATGALALAGAMALWNVHPSYSSANEALAPLIESETPASFANVIEAVRPAVVNISVNGHKATSVQRIVPGGPWGGPGAPFGDFEGTPLEDFLRRFFDRGEGAGDLPGRPFQAMGTGFIVDPEGLVVTNYHVVQDAEQINVIMDDGTRLSATLLGHDDKTDLALLDIEGEDLPFVAFGDSDAVRVGDWIVAIGNPFGLGGSATTGIVSARGRDIRSGPFDDFLQIDAPINRGNSGGPLFDLNGTVVGVNTAIFSPNGGNIGIGFAIPAAQVQPIIEELRTNGRVERGWLGVNVQDVTEELAAGLGLEEARGALVAGVVEDSPAERAGVLAGDVVVGLAGEPVEDVRELVQSVGESDPGDELELEVWRNGETRALRAELGEAEGGAIAPVLRNAPAEDSGRLGVQVDELDATTRRRLRLDDGVDGVVISRVARDSEAALRGLRPGDVIVGVGQSSVTSVQEYDDAIATAAERGRDTVALQVLRNGARTFIALPLS
jgi:serine protease Do